MSANTPEKDLGPEAPADLAPVPVDPSDPRLTSPTRATTTRTRSWAPTSARTESPSHRPPPGRRRRRRHQGRHPPGHPRAGRRLGGGPARPGGPRLPHQGHLRRRDHHVDDPYRYMPTLGEMDTYLISEGRHEELWEVLGATSSTMTAPWARSREPPSPCGPQRPRRTRRRRLQLLGRHRHRHALPGLLRGVGSCSFRASGSVRATSSSSASPTAPGTRRPTRWPAPPRR